MKDAELLELIHRDPSTGLEQLMRQYAGIVYAVIRGRIVNASYYSTDIEDCVADTFSEFYQELHRYDPSKGSIKAYLCQIARHNAIDLLRKNDHYKDQLSLDDEDGWLMPADKDMVESRILEDELRRELVSAIDGLGEPDSQIVLRKFYFRQSSKEIARALKLTVSNVDTRAHRALIKLRKQFGGVEE